MRLDKYLKTARILKRREAAKELALQGRIWSMIGWQNQARN